jgi:hypothetical protein
MKTKTIIIKTQEELDALPAKFEEFTTIEIHGGKFDAPIIIRENRENSSIILLNCSFVELHGNSRADLYGYSYAVLYGMAHAELRDSSRATLCENSSATLYGNSRASLMDSSSAVLHDNSSATMHVDSSSTLRDIPRIEVKK